MSYPDLSQGIACPEPPARKPVPADTWPEWTDFYPGFALSLFDDEVAR